MADNPQPPANEPDPEETFWAKFDARIEAMLDKKLAKPAAEPAAPPKPDKPEPEPLGKTRTGARRITIPSLVADMVFGPPKED